MSKKIYTTMIRNKFLTGHCRDIDMYIDALKSHVNFVRKMKKDRVKLEPEGIEDDLNLFYTEDAEVAKRYGLTEQERCEDCGSLICKHVNEYEDNDEDDNVIDGDTEFRQAVLFALKECNVKKPDELIEQMMPHFHQYLKNAFEEKHGMIVEGSNEDERVALDKVLSRAPFKLN